jgi:nicotinate-nucleotide pyrophosphorylase (carboxylating)
MSDLRDDILRSVTDNTVLACILAEEDGIVAETALAANEARRLGLHLESIVDEGEPLRNGHEITRFRGLPKQVALAEDALIGIMAKASGIATAAHKFVERAKGRPQIVSGAWKKMPATQKDAIRRAVVIGGASVRMCDQPFVYLDKNYIEMLGGIRQSLEAVAHLSGRDKVAQLKGRHADIVSEACEAVQYGADVLHLDTGQTEDVQEVVKELVRLGRRQEVKIAFSGNIRLEDMERLRRLDIDILDIGRQIVDAPLLDMRMEVIDVESPS